MEINGCECQVMKAKNFINVSFQVFSGDGDV